MDETKLTIHIDVVSEDDFTDPHQLDRFPQVDVKYRITHSVTGWPLLTITGTPDQIVQVLGWYYEGDEGDVAWHLQEAREGRG